MVGAPARTRALLLIVAGIAVLVAVEVVVHVGGAGSPPAPAGPAPRGLAARVDDETSPAAGGLVSWRSTWALCWDAYAGAQRYELRMLTGEGASPRLTSERGTCFRVEAAAGTSEPASMAGERDAQLASQAGSARRPGARRRAGRRAKRLVASGGGGLAVRPVAVPLAPIGDCPATTGS